MIYTLALDLVWSFNSYIFKARLGDLLALVRIKSDYDLYT